MQRSRDTMLNESDTAHLAGLYQQYAPVIFAYLLQHTPSEEDSEEDAEDILVEVFLVALESDQFSGLTEKAQLAWLWRVARNKMIDTYRRSARRPSVALEYIVESIDTDEDSDPEHCGLRQEEYTNLQDHLKGLSMLQQEVLRLRFSQDMRCSEIAAHLGKREGTVRVLLSRALNLLRNMYRA